MLCADETLLDLGYASQPYQWAPPGPHCSADDSASASTRSNEWQWSRWVCIKFLLLDFYFLQIPIPRAIYADWTLPAMRRRGERNDVKKTKIKEKMMNNLRDSKNSRMCEVQSKFPWMLRRLGILCLVLSRLRWALNEGCCGVRANRNFYIISHYILLQGSLVCGSPFSSTKTILPFCIRPNSEDFTRLIKKVQGWLLVWDKKKKDKYAV